jgi:Raf kinase inhibitor-like YbhB/YbcL family protein
MPFSFVIGKWLRCVRAGDRYLAWNHPKLATAPESIRLRSGAFEEGGLIPGRHAGAGVGENVSPPLEWSNLPAETIELLLIAQDPDAPLPRPVVHLLVFGIPPNCAGAAQGAFNPGAKSVFHFGRGLFGRVGYLGPRPVRGHGPHRYVFQIFALAEKLQLPGIPDLQAVLSAISGPVLARGRLIGIFERS